MVPGSQGKTIAYARKGKMLEMSQQAAEEGYEAKGNRHTYQKEAAPLLKVARAALAERPLSCLTAWDVCQLLTRRDGPPLHHIWHYVLQMTQQRITNIFS